LLEPELLEPELLEPELLPLEPPPELDPELPPFPPPELPSLAITGEATRPTATTVAMAAAIFFRLNMMKVLQKWVDKRHSIRK
jgi:hypothetical protein